MENIEKVEEMANWCLNCKMKPCSEKGCPMHTPIPEFISKIKSKNYEEAYNLLIENNIFSHVCSIVCPQSQQCEGSCIRGIKQTPTQIGNLEKFVNEWAEENKIKFIPKIKEKNKKKIAIIGSGPAGIECGYELLKNGYDVTIYEKESNFGGILWYGIPDFRLPKNIVTDIIYIIKKMGAKFVSNCEFGKDITIKQLQENFDAIFIGIGASVSTIYSLSDEENEKIYKSDEFLKKYSEKDFIKDLGKVVVIGGGNVAMDASRTAKKMGAENVKILYRRDKEHMPASDKELDDAILEGVEFVPLTRVISANIENGKIKSVNCIRTQIIDNKAVDVPDTEFEIEADSVVFAIGLKPEKNILESQGIELNDWNMVEINEDGMTNLKNVYAGGDISESKSTVCRALAAGRKAAIGIMKNI